MTDVEWAQAIERGKRTSIADILNDEVDNFFGSGNEPEEVMQKLYVNGPVSPLPSKQVKA